MSSIGTRPRGAGAALAGARSPPRLRITAPAMTPPRTRLMTMAVTVRREATPRLYSLFALLIQRAHETRIRRAPGAPSHAHRDGSRHRLRAPRRGTRVARHRARPIDGSARRVRA